MSEPLRILLTEGSSLTARQALYALGPAGHILEFCDPNPLFCLARFSRFVRAGHACPPFGVDPAGYLQFLVERLRKERYDVLLPVHDQAYLLSRFRDQLRPYAGLAVPDFAAMERVQSKASFSRLLDELGLPQPPTVFVSTRRDLEKAVEYPCYVKLPFATAGRGVWQVTSPEELRTLADQLEKSGTLDDGSEILVQRPAAGTLSVAQTVFRHGQLLAGHCYQARSQGVGGSAWAKIGVCHPHILEEQARLGAYLNWHGALMLDYIDDPATGTHYYIDANPRLGEGGNGQLSGVNLPELLVQISLDQNPAPPVGQPGVQTHNLATRLMALSLDPGQRRLLVRELWRAWRRHGPYADSREELCRPQLDRWSLLPISFITLQMLIRPGVARRIVRKAVANYALTEAAARIIRQMPADSVELAPVPVEN